ncbi:hypothetical protein RRG08_061134 [Elysia crispata]|uniref:Uncharacterized protein n=1 Tax=Elysia crispata TaxID=231223 RepID=A0AAE0XDZ5_9GAST|nr:hypothetical protein RRG08_061134 [Elysia crispata]
MQVNPEKQPVSRRSCLASPAEHTLSCKSTQRNSLSQDGLASPPQRSRTPAFLPRAKMADLSATLTLHGMGVTVLISPQHSMKNLQQPTTLHEKPSATHNTP